MVPITDFSYLLNMSIDIDRFYSKGNLSKVSYEKNANACNICMWEMQISHCFLKEFLQLPARENY